MSTAIAVTDGTFDTEVLQADRPVLVDFWAEWCAPCRAIAPMVEEIATEYASQLKVVKMDIGIHSATATRYGVMQIPTLILFAQGQPVERVTGAQSKNNLLKRLKPHLI